MQNFSRRLETAIAKSGIPKGVLSAHCGVALSTVSRWLDGTIPKPDTLEAIAQKLGVDSVWLLTGRDGSNATIERETPNQPTETIKETGQVVMNRMESMERNLAETTANLAKMSQLLADFMETFRKGPQP